MRPPIPYITLSKGVGSGWFAVKMWWNPDHGGFWEPYQTGFGRFQGGEEAIGLAEEEALVWAEAEGIEYKRPSDETLAHA